MRSASREPPWYSQHSSALTIAALLVPVGIILYSAWETGWARMLAHLAQNADGLRVYLSAGFLSLPFAVFFAGILVLERLRPASPGQPALSRGLIFDIGLMLLSLTVAFFVTSTGVMLATVFLATHTGLTIGAVAGWPNWVRVVLVLVVLDFGTWTSHLLRHRVPLLWRFHALHHSQREMNLMTEFRLHPIDSLNSTLLQSFTFVILLVPANQTLLFLLAEQYYLMFVHANVNISYGPLDAIFVSPRVHRIHHSAHAEHSDRNYAAFLSVWDTLFRTRYAGRHPVTSTGVADVPDERDVPLARLPAVYVRQWIWPFRSTRS